MGEGNERSRLEKMITDLNLQEHVFLLGHVSDAFQYIKAFDTFLLSSKSEALAYVVLEAGLQETPVVATAVGGIPEIVQDMHSGVLIQPRKPREIAHAINFFATHPDMARQYAKSLHETIKTKFTLERMINDTEKVYGK
jgi:glycosyltransferase involved in cell wall biosynthesis